MFMAWTWVVKERVEWKLCLQFLAWTTEQMVMALTDMRVTEERMCLGGEIKSSILEK